MFDGEAARAALAGDEAEARRLLDRAITDAEAAGPARGRVLLVGAGPGDPELLTLKAVRALKSADVILYDRLVGEGVLDYARREAELIPVGKSKGEASVPQAKINALLIEHARAGKTVLRLKGGDPFIFGRGGEELDALRAAGIDVEVVPGITAAIAAAASVQIPLTHRDISHSVTFVSGHEAGGEEPSFAHLDLAALAGGTNTLVVYMGVSTAGLVAAKLLAAGWRASCPVLAVENVSRPNERRVATSFGRACRRPGEARAQQPRRAAFRRGGGIARGRRRGSNSWICRR